MRLLVITQVMERKDSSLGFFVRWVEELSKRVDTVQVICLKRGEYDPYAELEKGTMLRRAQTALDRVAVHSIGKEDAVGSGSQLINQLRYILRFYRLLFRLRGTYDAVFVHMNEEYVLLAGPIWRMLRIPVFMWRNHYQGTWRTDIAAGFASKVFCTSQYSYTAKYKKTALMPVGVDISSLNANIPVSRKAHSILFLARFDRSKKPHLLVQALAELKKKGFTFTATFAGGPSDSAGTYVDEVKRLANELDVEVECTFVGAVPNTETYRYFRSHEIFVNCAGSGMLDKTIFEAAAAGCLVAASSLDIAKHVDASSIFKENDKDDLVRVLSGFLESSPEALVTLRGQFNDLVRQNTLAVLADRIVLEISPGTAK